MMYSAPISQGMKGSALFNINGELIETLYNGFQTLGTHHVVWDATDLSSGIYFISIENQKSKEVLKVINQK